ncbi:MAG: D-alanyl-D-alanine carboxypeptidase family protein, partial [Butyricicoccus sp.]
KKLLSLLLALMLTAVPLMPAAAAEDTEGTPSETTQAADSSSDSNADTNNNSDEPSDEDSAEQGASDQAETAKEEEETEDLDPTISLDAGASICVSAETGDIIHEYNSKEPMYPASTTKILTALVVLDNCEDLSETVTMEHSDFTDVENGASTAGLLEGETVTVESLLYCLLLPSGNEAANALARYIGGDVATFVQMMNDTADELGCVNSNFVNTNGLHDDNHYTCAYDLYLIAQAAMKYESFQTIVNTAQKKLPASNMQEERIIYTTNELIFSTYSPLYYANCYGIKTGHTTPAGYCLVSYAKNADLGLSYYTVVLGCQYDDKASTAGSFVETRELFDWAFQNFSMRTATSAQEPVTECHVRLGKNKDNVTLVTGEDVSVLLPKDADISMLDVNIQAEESYDAPIEKGQTLGTVTYSYHGTELASANLIALTGVERSQILFYLDQIKNFILSPLFLILLIILVLILVILKIIRSRNRRRRRRLRSKQKRNKNK